MSTHSAATFQQLEDDGWERAAHAYERSWRSLTELFIEPLLLVAGVTRGVRVLDVACGPGDLCAAAARRLAVPIGIDRSPTMIELARRRHPGRSFRYGDAERLPFADALFDAVTIGFGVLHLAVPEAAFAEARRVLRPGGRLAFSVWAKPEENPVVRIVTQVIEAHADLTVELPEGPSPARFADAEECRRCLTEAGFAPASIAFTTHQAIWRVPTAGFLFAAEREGGVRTAALLARQGPERLAAIGAGIEEGLRGHADGAGFALPFVAHIATAAVGDQTGD